MDALNMAAVGHSSTHHGFQPTHGADNGQQHVPARVRAALGHLLEAYCYARDLDANPWEFAIELSGLRRLQLSNSDLRWLVGSGLLEHGIEVTLGGEAERSFQHPSRLLFSKKTCFVLSSAGAEMAANLAPGASPILATNGVAATTPALGIAAPPSQQPPRWDRDLNELRVGQALVKCFKIPSPCEEAVLAAFEELSWPERIDDPLPPCESLAETIELLNRSQKQPLLRFLGDGAGQGIRWEYSVQAGTADA